MLSLLFFSVCAKCFGSGLSVCDDSFARHLWCASERPRVINAPETKTVGRHRFSLHVCEDVPRVSDIVFTIRKTRA